MLLKGLQAFFKKETRFFEDVHEYTIRVEFQGRGTLHVHACVWCTLAENYNYPLKGKPVLQGKSKSNRTSEMVIELESMFKASVDVQVDDGTGQAML